MEKPSNKYTCDSVYNKNKKKRKKWGLHLWPSCQSHCKDLDR